ncbi:MAG: Ribosomal RNA large subunit methyltransferase K [Chlamydiia bacterium]|nr:Ribosomal RNA large subunit methyltransferase K [Chlamydiia bacterium]
MGYSFSMEDLPLIIDGEDKSSPFKNRLRKNYKAARKWGMKTTTNAFRIYDQEILEYPYSIDFYGGQILIYTYLGKKEGEDPVEPLIELLGIDPNRIVWKDRIKRKRTEQYDKLDHARQFFTVYEHGVKFAINLIDYLDTGLFLDHRTTRQMVAKKAAGKQVLNLFCYTGAFSVHAAANGAKGTKSVDLSNTYLKWAKRNFNLNQIGLEHHTFVKADCMKFLNEEKEGYDLIIIDPPTLSRSKGMEEMFDVQRDYPYLLNQASKLLNQGGEIYFSTNLRNFRMDESLFPHLKIEAITHQTIPFDFHNQKIHQCFVVSISGSV